MNAINMEMNLCSAVCGSFIPNMLADMEVILLPICTIQD